MNVQICPHCQHQNRQGAKFCSGCGQALPLASVDPTIAAQPTPPPKPTTAAQPPPQAEPSPQQVPVICPYCGQHNQPGTRLCINCGRDLYISPSDFRSGAEMPQDTYPPAQKSKRTLLWIIIGAIIGLGVLIAGYFIIRGIIDAINPIDDIQETIVPALETVIDMTDLPGALETIIPDDLATEFPLEVPDDIPIELPTLEPISSSDFGIDIPRLTDEEEIEIGREAAAEFEKEHPISNDPALVSRVETIGKALLPFTPRQNLPYTFKVVDEDEINAFALPGGFIYVTRGMLEYVEEDHELAGVIGHELAHVALRHSAQLIEGLAAAQATMDAIASTSPELDSIYQDNSTQLAISAVAEIVINGWGRENELDADEHGTVYMAKASYLPLSIINLFERMQEEDDQPSDPLALMFSTHPPFRDRIQRVRQTIEKYNL